MRAIPRRCSRRCILWSTRGWDRPCACSRAARCTSTPRARAGSSSAGRLPSSMIEKAAPGAVRVRRALLSVSDKTGIVDFARGLSELGVEIVSTGGTARALSDAGVAVRPIEEFTGFPEMMDGRVKKLDPRPSAGVLALRGERTAPARACAARGIEPVDLVCVNLYPFEQTLARGDAGEAEIVENIDIGGPTMIRAAAKNSAFAAVIVDPEDYAPVLADLREPIAGEGVPPAGDGTGADGEDSAEPGRQISLETRTLLATKAFALTARYDAGISTRC